MSRRLTLSAIFIFLVFAAALPAQAGPTIARIKQSGIVRCGARTTANAYAYQTKDGEWHGIDVEICRLAASAVLGRPEAVQVVPVNKEEGFQLLENGRIDILAAATPWTMRTELTSNAAFPAPFYYSALAFIGNYLPDATSMKDYEGAKVCVENTPFLVRHLDDYNKRHKLNMRLMSLPSLSRAKELLYLKRCDLLFARLETLHSDYFKNRPADVDLAVLPEIVHTYASGPYIRDDDRELFKLMRWLIYGLAKAEEKGVSSQNIEDFQNTEDLEIKNLLEESRQVADRLGVDTKWLYRTIASQGNYGEIYQRGLGDKSLLKLKRSANRLTRDGGLISAPNFEE